MYTICYVCILYVYVFLCVCIYVYITAQKMKCFFKVSFSKCGQVLKKSFMENYIFFLQCIYNCVYLYVDICEDVCMYI